jgi:hypothetical protein
MVAINYASLQTVATQMIAMFGRAALLRDDDDNEVAVTAILTDYGARERDSKLIAPHDRRALVAVLAHKPDPETERLVIDGEDYRIVTVNGFAPGGTTLYFDLQVRA